MGRALTEPSLSRPLKIRVEDSSMDISIWEFGKEMEELSA